MRKLFILLFLFFTSTLLIAQVKTFNDLVGRWNIAGEKDGASLEIVDSSTIYLIYMGEKKKILNYSLDLTKSPAWFDFTVSDSTGTIAVKSLVQVFGEDTMKWQIFLDEDRTDYFSVTKGELMYLRKMTRPGSTVAKAND